MVIPAVYYHRAQRFRKIFTRELEKTFKQVDAIITPTTPISAYKIGEEKMIIGEEKVQTRELTSRLTRPFNLSGHPAISVPCGFSSSGLPIGLQIISKHFDELTALRVAHAYEINTSWHKRKPMI